MIWKVYGPIECFHMTSRRPYWCPKTMKRRPSWCPKPILWELNSFLMQTLSFVPINLHRCWSREWKHSIIDDRSEGKRQRTHFLQEKSILICTNYSEIIVICSLAESLSKRKNQNRYAYVGNWFCHFTLWSKWMVMYKFIFIRCHLQKPYALSGAKNNNNKDDFTY